MKKVKFILELILRILITFLILVIILVCIDRIIGIRREKDGGWTWFDETQAINQMLLRKYIEKEDKLYPTVLNKNETIPAKQPDEKRILVVGDSYVWGYAGDNKNYIWWKQLNQKIKKEGYENINVYGAGTWGLNTEDELNQILKNKHIMNKIDPDLIIISYVSNDAEQKDKSGNFIIPMPESWNYSVQNPKGSIFSRYFNNIFQETRDRIFNITDNEAILMAVGKVYGYRNDIRTKLIVSGESLKAHKKALIEVDSFLKEKDIPYFFYYCDQYVDDYNKIVEPIMNNNNISYYNSSEVAKEYFNKILYENKLKWDNIKINPVDWHPGTIRTNYYGDDILKYLHNNFPYLFEQKEDFQEYININDSMPYLNIIKETDNSYIIEYPNKETDKNIFSNFLYYPIKENYIKLNLEFPITINKVRITNHNLKKVDLYVNLFDEDVGFDIDNARQKLTKIKNDDSNTFTINKKITSLNISADFFDDYDRKLKIEFIN